MFLEEGATKSSAQPQEEKEGDAESVVCLSSDDGKESVKSVLTMSDSTESSSEDESSLTANIYQDDEADLDYEVFGISRNINNPEMYDSEENTGIVEWNNEKNNFPNNECIRDQLHQDEQVSKNNEADDNKIVSDVESDDVEFVPNSPTKGEENMSDNDESGDGIKTDSDSDSDGSHKDDNEAENIDIDDTDDDTSYDFLSQSLENILRDDSDTIESDHVGSGGILIRNSSQSEGSNSPMIDFQGFDDFPHLVFLDIQKINVASKYKKTCMKATENDNKQLPGSSAEPSRQEEVQVAEESSEAHHSSDRLDVGYESPSLVTMERTFDQTDLKSSPKKEFKNQTPIYESDQVVGEGTTTVQPLPKTSADALVISLDISEPLGRGDSFSAGLKTSAKSVPATEEKCTVDQTEGTSNVHPPVEMAVVQEECSENRTAPKNFETKEHAECKSFSISEENKIKKRNSEEENKLNLESIMSLTTHLTQLIETPDQCSEVIEKNGDQEQVTETDKVIENEDQFTEANDDQQTVIHNKHQNEELFENNDKNNHRVENENNHSKVLESTDVIENRHPHSVACETNDKKATIIENINDLRGFMNKDERKEPLENRDEHAEIIESSTQCPHLMVTYDQTTEVVEATDQCTAVIIGNKDQCTPVTESSDQVTELITKTDQDVRSIENRDQHSGVSCKTEDQSTEVIEIEGQSKQEILHKGCEKVIESKNELIQSVFLHPQVKENEEQHSLCEAEINHPEVEMSHVTQEHTENILDHTLGPINTSKTITVDNVLLPKTLVLGNTTRETYQTKDMEAVEIGPNDSNLTQSSPLPDKGMFKEELQAITNIVPAKEASNVNEFKCVDVTEKTELIVKTITASSSASTVREELTREDETEGVSKTKTPQKSPKETSFESMNKSSKGSLFSTPVVPTEIPSGTKSFFFGRDERNETHLRTTAMANFQVGGRVSLPTEDEPVDPMEVAMFEESLGEEVASDVDEGDRRNTCMLDVDLCLRLSEEENETNTPPKPVMVDKSMVTTDSYLTRKARRSSRNITPAKKDSFDVRKPAGSLTENSQHIINKIEISNKEKHSKQSFGTQTTDLDEIDKIAPARVTIHSDAPQMSDVNSKQVLVSDYAQPSTSADHPKGILKRRSRKSSTEIRTLESDFKEPAKKCNVPDDIERENTRKTRRSSISSQSRDLPEVSITEIVPEEIIPKRNDEPVLHGILKNSDKVKSKRHSKLPDEDSVSKEKKTRRSTRLSGIGESVTGSSRHSIEPKLRGILKNKDERLRPGSSTSESASDLRKRLDDDFPEEKKKSRRCSEEPDLYGILKRTEGLHKRNRKSIHHYDSASELHARFEKDFNKIRRSRKSQNELPTEVPVSSSLTDGTQYRSSSKKEPTKISGEPQLHGILKNKSDRGGSYTTESADELKLRLEDVPEVKSKRRRQSVDSKIIEERKYGDNKPKRHSYASGNPEECGSINKRRLSEEPETEIRGILKNKTGKERRKSSYTSETSDDLMFRLEEDFTVERKRRRRHSVDSASTTESKGNNERKSKRYSHTSVTSSDTKSARKSLVTSKVDDEDTKYCRSQTRTAYHNERALSEDVPSNYNIPSASSTEVGSESTLRQSTPDSKKRRSSSKKPSQILDLSESTIKVPKKPRSLQDFPVRMSSRLHPILEEIKEEDEETPKKKMRSFDDIDVLVKKKRQSTKKKETKTYAPLVIVDSDDAEESPSVRIFFIIN